MSQDLLRERKTKPTFDMSAVLLEAVVSHLNSYVHELKYTFSSARNGIDGLSLYVGSHYRCAYTSETAVLAAWAKTMTDVTAEARIVDDAVHLNVKGKLVDTTPAEVHTVETDDAARCWIVRLDAEDRTDVPVPIGELLEMAAELEPRPFVPASQEILDELDRPAPLRDGPCPYTHSHTRFFCGRVSCRES